MPHGDSRDWLTPRKARGKLSMTYAERRSVESDASCVHFEFELGTGLDSDARSVVFPLDLVVSLSFSGNLNGTNSSV